MIAISSFVLLFLSLTSIVTCSSFFIYPPALNGPTKQDPSKNIRYEAGEHIEIKWFADFGPVDILLSVTYIGDNTTITGETFTRILDGGTSKSLDWAANFMNIAKTRLKPDEDGIFYLSLYEKGQKVRDSRTADFNITNSDIKSYVPSSTANESSTATAGASTIGSNDEDKESGLSPGAAAGAAVAATLGGICLLAGVGFIAWRYFRQRASSESHHQNYTYTGVHDAEGAGYAKAELASDNVYGAGQAPWHAHSVTERYELGHGSERIS